MDYSEANIIAKEGIVVFNANLQIIQFNNTFLEITGKKEEEIKGSPLSLYIPEITDLKLDQPFIHRKPDDTSTPRTWIILPLKTGNILSGGIVIFETQKTLQVDDEKSGKNKETISQKDIVKAILETQEEERKRIAEAIHNELGQLLYAIKLQTERLDPAADINLQALAKNKIDSLLEEAIREVRSISYDLTPRLLEDFGFEYAIEELCRRISHENLKINCSIDLASFTPGKNLQIAIFRILQELVNNIIKHSHANNAKVLLAVKDKNLEISVEDDGIGFKLLDESQTGLGLRSIKNRVKLLNGTINIEAIETKGTKVLISIPIL